MKVALAIPRIDKKYEKFGLDVDWGWWAPLGLLTVASYIKKNNKDIDVLILDEQLMDQQAMKMSLIDYSPEWLGVSPDYLTYENSLELARLAKSLKAKVVFGGHFASNLGKTMLKNRTEIDYIVMQDGELAMDGLINGKDFFEINNLIWRSNGLLKVNKVILSKLDSLPSIDYSLLDLDAYFINYLNNQERRGIYDQPFQKPLTFTSQRGCRWREKSKGCLFCSCIYSVWRGRNPVSVWEDVVRARDNYGVDSMVFGEDDFLSSIEWFNYFYEKRPKKNCLGIRFAYVNACAINKTTVKQLSELNCYQVFIGFESGDNNCLRKLHKEARIEQTLAAARLLKEYGIKFNASFSLGAPGESKRSLEKSYVFAQKLKELGANGFNAYPLLPIPGSKAWNMIMRKSKEFYELNFDQDMLEPDELVRLWIKHFCLVTAEEVLLVCEKINNMFFHDWNFKLI